MSTSLPQRCPLSLAISGSGRFNVIAALALVLLAGCTSFQRASTEPEPPATVVTATALSDHIAAGEFVAARALMTDDPRRWFDDVEGEGATWTVGPRAAGPWKAWDEHFRKRTETVGWDGNARTATLTFRETNDYFQLLDRGWVTNQAVYLFDERGRVRGLLIRSVGARPPGRTEEFLAWARGNEPEELTYLQPGDRIDPSGDRPERYRALLNRWRRSSGLSTIE